MHKYTCIVDTPYSLALFLLKKGPGAFGCTRFYVGESLGPDIEGRLEFVKKYLWDSSQNATLWKSRLYAIKRRLNCFVEYLLHVMHTEIYAQDHLFRCSSQLICGGKYTLIEDGPCFYSYNIDSPIHKLYTSRNPVRRFWVWALHGSTYRKTIGRNSQCVNRWVTQMRDVELYKREGVMYEYFNLRELWNKTSPEWQSRVLRILGGDGAVDVLGKFDGIETILLSQPMMEDCGLSEKEMSKIYQAALCGIDTSRLVIKPHPRDTFAFRKYFPLVRVVETKIPMQLLCEIGVDCKKVITICSSSVSAFRADVELIWIGTRCHPLIEAQYGNPSPPDKFKHVVRIF